MNIALYARVSSDSQDVERSIGAQVKALEEFAERSGHRIVRRFIDEARSGTSDNRPAFRELIDFARLPSHPVDAVLVWKFNRFSRVRLASVTYKHALNKVGVEVISINEPVDDSPSGKMMEAVIEAYDEFFSANLGQDISRGMRQSAVNGNFVASIAPYGYRKKAMETGDRTHWTLEPEASEAELVKQMFRRAESGAGLKRIASELNSAGVVTRRGKTWSNSGIRKILDNDAYTRTLVWGVKSSSRRSRTERLTPVRIENAWPSLVSKNLFKRVQASLLSRRPSQLHPRVASSHFMLTGFSRCGGCGSALTGHVAKSGAYRYYQCSGRNKRGTHTCSQRMVRRDAIESAVLGRVRDVLLSPANIDRIVKEINRELRGQKRSNASQLAKIDIDITTLTEKLERYYEAFESGDLEAQRFSDRVSDLKSRLAELNIVRLNVKTGSGARSMSAKEVSQYVERLRSTLERAEPNDRKTVLRSFIEQIEVSGDEVAVEYHLPVEEPTTGDKVLSTVNSGGAEGIRTRPVVSSTQTG